VNPGGNSGAAIPTVRQGAITELTVAEGPRVRIHVPPAESPSLAPTRPLQVENPGFQARVRGWVGGAVGRDAQALVEIARTGLDISVGP
jgi:hypothetical protein